MEHYFDYNASTPVSPEVLAVLAETQAEVWGNPSSIHRCGQRARARVEAARESVARLLGCGPKEIVFTSGGTESDNLALLGAMRAIGAAGRHVVTSAIEHPAVLIACSQLEREGAAVTYVAPGGDGVVDPEAVRRALRPETALVSVMHANNETGVIQPVAEIARIAHEAGALFHSDGVQAAARLKVDVRELGVDLYAITGHKFYAPKGAGALYVREGVKLQPLQFGGRHERERRPGTENVPAIAALGAAAEWLLANVGAEAARLAALRDRLERRVLERVPGAAVNCAGAPRTANTSNIRFDGIEGDALVIALDLAGFAVSTGAACSSGAVHASHVLTAMGLTNGQARSSMRFSLGRGNGEAQVDSLVDAVESAVARLRKLSPVYPHA
jgi:cysteine desulfurase